MGHSLAAVIGPAAQVREFAGRWVHARVCELPQGFALVPLTHQLLDDIDELAALTAPDPYQGFVYLSAGVCQALAEASGSGWLGYLETDYFGGVGSQSALAFHQGRLAVEPGSSSHRLGPINRSLLAMGVTPRAGQDAFDALGLGDYRTTE